jgi:drug/metabolite transporter (DMT)-like permease
VCRPSLLLLRGLLGTVSVCSIFFAIRYLPLADFTALTFLAPAFVAVISPCVLGETTARVWPALIACTLGVILVTQPSFLFGRPRLKLIGLMFGLLQPLASGAAKARAFTCLCSALCVSGCSLQMCDFAALRVYCTACAWSAAVPETLSLSLQTTLRMLKHERTDVKIWYLGICTSSVSGVALLFPSRHVFPSGYQVLQLILCGAYLLCVRSSNTFVPTSYACIAAPDEPTCSVI